MEIITPSDKHRWWLQGRKRQRRCESTSAKRRDFSGPSERHGAAKFPCFRRCGKNVFSFMNMHIWNLLRRNPPPPAGWGINRVQLSIKDEESAWMEGIVQRGRWVRTVEGWLRRWRHQKQEGATLQHLFFFFFSLRWKDTFHCGRTGGSQSRSSLFFNSSEFIRLIRRKLHEGEILGEQPGVESIPLHSVSSSSPHHLPARWKGCFREKLWLATPSLSCKTRCNEGLGLDPEAQSGWTNPVEMLMWASCGRQC